jgi:hypothetical protein
VPIEMTAVINAEIGEALLGSKSSDPEFSWRGRLWATVRVLQFELYTKYGDEKSRRWAVPRQYAYEQALSAEAAVIRRARELREDFDRDEKNSRDAVEGLFHAVVDDQLAMIQASSLDWPMRGVVADLGALKDHNGRTLLNVAEALKHQEIVNYLRRPRVDISLQTLRSEIEAKNFEGERVAEIKEIILRNLLLQGEGQAIPLSLKNFSGYFDIGNLGDTRLLSLEDARLVFMASESSDKIVGGVLFSEDSSVLNYQFRARLWATTKFLTWHFDNHYGSERERRHAREALRTLVSLVRADVDLIQAKNREYQSVFGDL